METEGVRGNTLPKAFRELWLVIPKGALRSPISNGSICEVIRTGSELKDNEIKTEKL